MAMFLGDGQPLKVSSTQRDKRYNCAMGDTKDGEAQSRQESDVDVSPRIQAFLLVVFQVLLSEGAYQSRSCC